MSSSVVTRAAHTTAPGDDAGRVATEQEAGRRRANRYVVLVGVLGMLLTLGATYAVGTKPGVYYSQVKVLFLAPSSRLFPNALVNGSGGIITVAGTVGKMVDPRESTARVVSPKVTLVNQGIRHGYSVTLPNDGGQFADNFDQPLLDVQAVGSSASEVTRQVQLLVDEIIASLDELQDRAGVVPVNRITTSLSPSQIQVSYATGSRLRAVGASVVLGFVLTAAAVHWLRRRLRRPRGA